MKAWGGELGEVGGRSGWQGRSVQWSFLGDFQWENCVHDCPIESGDLLDVFHFFCN